MVSLYIEIQERLNRINLGMDKDKTLRYLFHVYKWEKLIFVLMISSGRAYTSYQHQIDSELSLIL